MLEYGSNILDYIKNNKINVQKISDLIANQFKDELVAKDDEILMNMVFEENPSQEAFDDFISKWDIEIEGGSKSLLLAYYMKLHPEIKFPQYVAPRLSGLLQYYRFRNMKLISDYTKIGNEFAKNNIEILILKGGAMKYLRPDFPRLMGDIDILVHKKDFEKAKRIVKKMGYNFLTRKHSIDLYKDNPDIGILDIHHRLAMLTGLEDNISEDLFSRASLQKVFGIDTYLPCIEDMFFVALVNLMKNLTIKHTITGILFALFDCQYLLNLKPNFNWNIVKENAIKTKTETQIYMAIKFINKIVPKLLPDKIGKNGLFEKEFEDYCTLLVYNRFFILKLREQSRAMKLKDAIKHRKTIMEYLAFRPKYFWYKRKFLRTNPKLARNVLIKQGNIICA